MLCLPFQVGVHIIKAVVFSQVNQDPRGTATLTGSTEAAVADPSAGRAQPLLHTRTKSVTAHTIKCGNSSAVQTLTGLSRASRTSSP